MNLIPRIKRALHICVSTVWQELALDTRQTLTETISISLPNKNLTSTNKDSVVYTDPALSHGGSFSSLKEETDGNQFS